MKIKTKLVDESHPLLRVKAQPVLPEELKGLAAKLGEIRGLMYKYKGQGLAGPQLGCSKRFFVWTFGMVINPEILEKSADVSVMPEGCLTFPLRDHVSVTRARTVKVRYTDENLRVQEKTLTGLPARCFQHEFDHLEGVVIY